MLQSLYLGVLLLLAAGCAGAAGAPPKTGAPVLDAGPIRPPSALDFDFQWRQRVTATWPTGSHTFDAVLQKRSGELLLLGLSPMGLPGFILRLREDGKIEVENRTGRDLPFQPEYILADVERVFFPWLPAAPAAISGERSGDYQQLQIRERFENGQLRERSFQRRDAPQSGAVSIRYQPTKSPGEASPRVDLDNAWFHYKLAIETLEQTRL